MYILGPRAGTRASGARVGTRASGDRIRSRAEWDHGQWGPGQWDPGQWAGPVGTVLRTCGPTSYLRLHCVPAAAP